MTDTFDIAGYCRISVDDELDRDNTSIENQKSIIKDYVRREFPGSTLTFFADRDRSGYTFEQREGYQQMRRELVDQKYGILIVKDFSRFSRRNGRGLVELEDLRDAGVRIISIGDGIDYPTNDDWLQIQLHFFINEMPVTDTSKKVKNVIKRRQTDGKWICAVPYGYVITNTKSMSFEVDETAAEVVRLVFRLYNEGWGYKKIANHLTELSIPTPRMQERERVEAAGGEYRIKTRPQWSIVTVQGILDNDFYIGTLRQHKYARKKINGADVKIDADEHIVFENHHKAIVDYRTFAAAREQREKRSVTNYRGVKINENAYSGFLFCGDCGAPMFAMSRRDLRPAYTCGSYHRRGLKGCTSHHIRVDVLDEILKTYIKKVRENSADMIERLEHSIKDEGNELKSGELAISKLGEQLDSAREELKATKRQKIREILRRPEQEHTIEETYAELEAELEARISGLQNQLSLSADRRNAVIRINRTAKTVIDIFDDILRKDKLDKLDLDLIIERIRVYEGRAEVSLKNDIDKLLRYGAPTENDIVQASSRRPDRLLHIDVVSGGDPLEIYTERDGEVIFKKYSPIGELSEFAAQICDSLNKTTGFTSAVCDRDSIIAVAGNGKKELNDKRISADLEVLMESRKLYSLERGAKTLSVINGDERHCLAVAAPILSQGDVLGCVIISTAPGGAVPGELETKLAQTVASFLGKQMES